MQTNTWIGRKNLKQHIHQYIHTKTIKLLHNFFLHNNVLKIYTFDPLSAGKAVASESFVFEW